MKTILTFAVVLTNFVAMGSVASAQCHGYGYRGVGYGPAPYAGFRAIPAGRLPANVVFKAIQTEEGIVIVAVPQGIGGGANGPLNNGPVNGNGPINNGPVNNGPVNNGPVNVNPPAPVNPVPPAPQVNPQPQIQPQPQPQVQPQPAPQQTSVAQNVPNGPSSPFFNIPDRTVPSGNFSNGGNSFQPTNFSSGGSNGFNNGFNNGGFNGGNGGGNNGGSVVQNGGNRAPAFVNGAAVRNAPSVAPPSVNNGATRFEFKAPSPGRR